MRDHLSTRRAFLQRSLALLSAGATVPAFLDQTVWAIENPADAPLTQRASGKDGKILVVVQLSGGNDGLNTVVPYADDAYHRARPQLAHAGRDVLKVNDYLGLHPNLAPLKALYDDGRMSIVQGVGYPNPNRSHFRSMDIWHSAAPERENVTTGWLGRYFDNACPGADPHVGVSIGDVMPLSMKGDRVTPLAFERPEAYRYAGRDTERYLALNRVGGQIEGITGVPPVIPSQEKKHGRDARATNNATNNTDTLDFLHRTAMDAQLSSDQILRITKSFRPTGDYPGGEYGDGLRTIAAMIGGGLPTRVYYVSLGGFDTHAGQRGRHDNLLQQFARGVDAFWADIKRQRNDDRVLMLTFSEFGRRVEQNASGGTDHGAAAPLFVFGPKLRSGVLGRHPSLTDLDAGDLRYTTDFRSVYATVLQEWLDTPSKPILGQQFKTMPILRA